MKYIIIALIFSGCSLEKVKSCGEDPNQPKCFIFQNRK